MQTLNDTDQNKVGQIAQNMERDGWQGRPILVIVMGNEKIALTGSHRLAAADQAEIQPVTYEIDSDDYTEDQLAELFDARDDEDRLDALRDMDGEAAALMAAEVEANSA